MKSKMMKVLSVMLTLALLLTSIALPDFSKKADAAGDTFKFYFYYETESSLCMAIWDDTGIDFADSTEVVDLFGWGKQAILQPVEDNANWYSVDMKIKDATASGGLSIYDGIIEDNDKRLVQYDNQWNNTADYATLVGGSKDAYAIKDWTLYTDLSAAGLTVSTTPVDPEDSLNELKTLVASVPEDYQTLGFAADSVTAVKQALETANGLITANSSDASAIDAAYKALSDALDGLAFSADIFVQKVNNYDESSIRGMDVSSYLSIMNSFEKVKADKRAAGASEAEINKIGFKDWNGNVLNKQGFFNLLAASGVNYIRLRVWNDPFDADGKGYGGGNNDLNAAIEMGKYATNAGMKLLIDFHLSDFWGDPERQLAPKAWKNYTADQKATAAAAFVTDSLKKLVTDNGVDVAMVQIGNETNNGVSGESDWADRNKIFDAGCDAVHAFNSASGKNILAAVHFTDPQNEGYSMGCADNLANYDGDGDGEKEGVSYDIFASTYYPNSHGTMANITSVLDAIARKYNKYVMVAETSWATSHTDGNDLNNNEGFRTGDYVNYPVTVQGQANEIRDVANAVNNISATLESGERAALGFFYWEPAWIPVQSLYDETGALKSDAAQIYEENKVLWDEYGSGWASNYAASYDAVVATWGGGGSSMTNQAVFDFNGNPLASLNVYKYLKYGAKASEVKPDGYIPAEIDIEVGSRVESVLPDITVIYTDSSQAAKAVNWNQTDINTVNTKAATTAGLGTYTVNGTLAEDASFKVTATVNVLPVNLLTDPSFEKEESAWTITGDGAVINGEDSKSGSKGLHFWLDSDFAFAASTTVTVTKAGSYSAYVWVQGKYEAGTRDGEYLRLKAVTADGGVYTSQSVAMDGWLKWKQIKLEGVPVFDKMLSTGSTTITLIIEASLKSSPNPDDVWGTFDDAYLYLDKEAITPGSTSTVPAVSTPAPSDTPAPDDTPRPDDTPNPDNTPNPVQTPKPDDTVTPSAEPTPGSTATVTKPKKVSVTKAKAAKKKVTVTWKKVAKVDGYQVQYSTNKNFKNAKSVFVKGTSKVIKKLKSKKTYYIRVRAYKKNGSKKIYGAYSKKTKVKVK